MRQMDIEDYYPNTPGSKGTKTSQEAARKVRATANTQKERVLKCLQEFKKPLTAEQISSLIKVSLTATRSRLSELKADGIADHAGEAQGQYTTIVTWKLVK